MRGRGFKGCLDCVAIGQCGGAVGVWESSRRGQQCSRGACSRRELISSQCSQRHAGGAETGCRLCGSGSFGALMACYEKSGPVYAASVWRNGSGGEQQDGEDAQPPVLYLNPEHTLSYQSAVEGIQGRTRSLAFQHSDLPSKGENLDGRVAGDFGRKRGWRRGVGGRMGTRTPVARWLGLNPPRERAIRLQAIDSAERFCYVYEHGPPER